MISDIDIRDWDRAEKIVGNILVDSEDAFTTAGISWEDYWFLRQLLKQAKEVKKPKLPAILSWWRAA